MTAILELASRDEFGSKLHPAALVHHKDRHGGAAGRSTPKNVWPLKLEMLAPLLVPRVKETLDLAGLWVNSREVCSLIGVTSVTGDAQVVVVISAAVDPRPDVLDVERDEGLGALGQAAVFATVLRTLSDDTSGGCIHQPLGCLARTARAFACKMLMTSTAST